MDLNGKEHIVSGEDVPTMTFPLQRGAKFCDIATGHEAFGLKRWDYIYIYIHNVIMDIS